MGDPAPAAAAAATRALRGARDLYVRGIRGLDRLLAAAGPRKAGVGRPTSSRVFGVGGSRHSEEDLWDLVRATQVPRAAAASVGSGGNKEDAASGAPPVKRRGATPLERISEDAAVVHPTSSQVTAAYVRWPPAGRPSRDPNSEGKRGAAAVAVEIAHGISSLTG